MAAQCLGPASLLGEADWCQLRAECLFTASDVPEACGIGYQSRAQWCKRRLLRQPQPPPSEREREILLNGHVVEPLAKWTYLEAFDLSWDDVLDEPFYHRGKVIGASPDLVVISEPRRCVEFKCVDYRQREPVFQPSANHVLQLATQLYVTGLSEGHLFYYRSTDSNWVCYGVSLPRPELYEELVFPWLNEALNCESSKRVSDAAKRAQAVMDAFLSKA